MELVNFFQSLQSGESILTYKGFFSSPVLDDLLVMLEARLLSLGEKDVLRKKIFTICTEMLQNLFHREDLRWQKGWISDYENVIFRLDKSNNTYYISVGNFVDELTKSNLISKIDEVNSLSKEALKERYKEVLQTSEFTSKGGAGLGILDIARRSNEKMEYTIMPTSTDYSFFCIRVKVTA